MEPSSCLNKSRWEFVQGEEGTGTLMTSLCVSSSGNDELCRGTSITLAPNYITVLRFKLDFAQDSNFRLMTTALPLEGSFGQHSLNRGILVLFPKSVTLSSRRFPATVYPIFLC